MSVPDLAKRVGMHPQSLRNVELGRRPASAEKLAAIAAALGVDVAELTATDMASPTPTPAPSPDAEALADIRVYNAEEAADMVRGGITPQYLMKLAREGEPHTRIGRRVGWTLQQLREVVARHAVGGTAAQKQRPAPASSPAPEPEPAPRASSPRRAVRRTAAPAGLGQRNHRVGRRYLRQSG